MKSLILSGVSLLLLGSLIAPAKASETLTPAQVTNLAYQGYLSPSGIDGYSSLIQGVLSHEVDGRAIVEAATANGLLPQGTEMNSHFVSSVDSMLDGLAREAIGN